MFLSHLYPEKSGAGRGIVCTFFLAFREALPAKPSLTPEVWLCLRLNHAGAAWSEDLCSIGTQGSPHPAQAPEGAASKPFCTRAKLLLNFLLCAEQPLSPQTDQPTPSPQLCS